MKERPSVGFGAPLRPIDAVLVPALGRPRVGGFGTDDEAPSREMAVVAIGPALARLSGGTRLRVGGA